MKKKLCLLSALMLLSFLFPCPCPAAGASEGKVTILVYLCGSDLESSEGEASDDVREMLSSGVGSSGAVNVLLATGGASRWSGFSFSSRSVQYHRLENGAPVLLKDAGSRSMGSADTLSAFLRYAVSAAPAERYILILWDHGGGPVHGLCNDENHRDDSLSLAELKAGLTDGLQGRKLDIIGFDCCLMNCVDLCLDMYGIADYSVLSQELVSGTGLDYDGWMGPVAADPSIPTEEIAGLMARTYVEENGRGRRASAATMSVIASERMPGVAQAADAFSAALTELAETNLAGVIRARNQLTSFGEFMDQDASDLVDVQDMCDAFSPLLPGESAALKQAAREAVCYNAATDDIAAYAHGMSFFLPYRTVREDRQDILSHYSGQSGAYAAMVSAMTGRIASSGYSMTASSSAPGNFYSYTDDSFSGAFCDIWDGYCGDSCSFGDAFSASGGNIWAGLNLSGGSVWDGLSSSSGIWSGYEPQQPAPASVPGGIWSGLEGSSPTAAPSQPPQAQAGALSVLDNIWAGLLNPGADYYQPGEENQNVQAGVSEAVPAESVIEAANDYFSSAVLTSQRIYSLQLNREDLDHLSSASGVLSRKEGGETIRFGNLGRTTIDWSTGLVVSMFDGSWPMLEGEMVRAEYFYGDEDGNTRFVIPVRINGLKLYLLGNCGADGETELLGATQGYDEQGFAIRGVIPLEEGMTVFPLFTAVSADGTEREYAGSAVTVPAGGLKLTWEKIPDGSYEYCFGLTDLSGRVHYTESVALDF